MTPIMWDEAAQQALSKEITRASRGLALKDAREKEQQLLEQSRRVGSEVYTKMFKASNQTAGKKILLLLNQLGAQLEEGTLQLQGPYILDPDLAPHDEFLSVLAKTVQQAYQGKILDHPRVHQLRMYLDRQNIAYIRSRFGKAGQTDEAALAAYVKTPKQAGGLGGKKLLAERARLHNKYKANYRAGEENRKRLTPDFHSEFILDPQGNFISQWNVLEWDETGKLITDFFYYKEKFPTYSEWDYFQQQILNGESFNFAERNDSVHRQLDSLPPGRLDYPLRKQLAKNWHNPQNKQEYHWRKVDRKPGSYSRRQKLHKKIGLAVLLLFIGKRIAIHYKK